MHESVVDAVVPGILGQGLQKARRARGLTQQEVADSLELARTTVTALEKGERRIRPDELISLAGLYGRQVSTFVGSRVSPNQRPPRSLAFPGLFLFFLHQQVNRKLISEERYFWTQGRFLIAELKSLLREQALGRRMRWNQIRVGIETPYPLDSETAAAVEAAKQHYVMTWELLEEGDDLGQWLLESFLAKGNTALPDGVYGMMSGAKHLYSKVPTEDEVRPLFEDAESFQKFLDGEDYSYGLADVPDAEYDAHYEAIVSAIKGVAKQGIVVDMPSVPHQFLQEAPLVDGDWIDGYIVELAEWGARLVEKGLLLEESGDYHPMAWKRIINQEHGSEACAAVSMKLWQQTRKRLAAFPGSTRVIDERQYLNFADYLKWRGRRNKGDLKSGMRRGLVVSSWNQWVESQGGEGVATLAGVASGILDCYLDGYRYRVCRNAGELAEEVSRRESLLESVKVWEPDSSNDERFRQRVEHWKISALGFLPEIYILSRAINSISQRYFEGQDPLFSEVSDGFGQLLALVEKLVNIYNEALAGDIERSERLLIEPGEGQNQSPLTIDLAGLVETVQGSAREQVAYLVDMAKADALDLLGETRQAFELVERHV